MTLPTSIPRRGARVLTAIALLGLLTAAGAGRPDMAMADEPIAVDASPPATATEARVVALAQAMNLPTMVRAVADASAAHVSVTDARPQSPPTEPAGVPTALNVTAAAIGIAPTRISASEVGGDQKLASAVNAVLTHPLYPELASLTASALRASAMGPDVPVLLFPGVGTLGGIFGATVAAAGVVRGTLVTVGLAQAGLVLCGVSVVCAVTVGVVAASALTAIAITGAAASVFAVKSGVEYDANHAGSDVGYASQYAFCLATGACNP